MAVGGALFLPELDDLQVHISLNLRPVRVSEALGTLREQDVQGVQEVACCSLVLCVLLGRLGSHGSRFNVQLTGKRRRSGCPVTLTCNVKTLHV